MTLPIVVASDIEPAVLVLVGGLFLCFMLVIFMRLVRSFGGQNDQVSEQANSDLVDQMANEKVGTSVATDIQATPPRSWKLPPSEIAPARRAGLGQCRLCHYGPLAYGAPICPQCFGKDPNPGVISRFAFRGAIGGVLLGCGAGIIWGLLVVQGGVVVGIIMGTLLGSLAGIFVGMAGGLFLGVVAKLAGKQ